MAERRTYQKLKTDTESIPRSHVAVVQLNRLGEKGAEGKLMPFNAS